MSKQFIIAQAGSSGSTAAPVQIIKVIKPPAGHTEVFHASFTGAVKVDFTAIANEKITLYHDNTDQTLHIIFTDGSQAIIEPFFELDGRFFEYHDRGCAKSGSERRAICCAIPDH